MTKTFIQHIFKREDIAIITMTEASAAEANFKHKCDCFLPTQIQDSKAHAHTQG